MSRHATFKEVVDLLGKTAGASVSWAEGLYAARLSVPSIVRLLETMSRDVDSPLRENEEGILGDEIRRLNLVRGADIGNYNGIAKFTIRIKAVLSPSEQVRVCRIVNAFAQPTFETKRCFSRNGHAVMNAVRRIVAGYSSGKIPNGASCAEIGPDVRDWMLSPSPGAWSGKNVEAYNAARPSMTPRDCVRLYWAALAAHIVEARQAFYSADTVEKARIFHQLRESVFSASAVPTDTVVAEYLFSYDANYDIKFSDMPVAMEMAGARAWYGSMSRAKGLTEKTRLKEGELPLMGVRFRVDWEKRHQIDFRHPECNAFGYSHDVWEYMKYESRNGYVWTTDTCHYVYSKGPETTDEILFFQVVRVPKLHRMMEPRFVENPKSGLIKLSSIWAVGDEVDGVPRKFEKIDFHVDALNYSKVIEKRRALDFKGDLTVTLSLVRSTNVRFYLFGTPVGVNERIETRLAEATAVVVEALVHQQRLVDNGLFDMAMYSFDASVKSHGWFFSMLGELIDFKAVTGRIAGPIVAMWSAIRSRVIDVALSPLSNVKVGAELVPEHVCIGVDAQEKVESFVRPVGRSLCVCGEIAELRTAIELSSGSDKAILEDYLASKMVHGRCSLCGFPELDQIEVDTLINEDEDTSSSEELATDTDATSVSSSDIEEVHSSWSDDCCADYAETKSVKEFISLENYLTNAHLIEARRDATNLFKMGPISHKSVAQSSTSRTRHTMLQFLSGRCVKIIGDEAVDFGALYDMRSDQLRPIVKRKGVMTSSVSDGWYYTCNRLEIWNSPVLVSAAEYALTYGSCKPYRKKASVVLGVPGAGKTWMMMKAIAERWKSPPIYDFLVLAATNKSVNSAIDYGIQFGIDKRTVESRVMTIDRYLMHAKFPARALFVDEVFMVHIGKVDAAVAISSADEVSLFGDARQIPYDPFCNEFKMQHSTLGDTVDIDRVKFLGETHRFGESTCAMWVDQYPYLYPCECCDVERKNRGTIEWERVKDISHLIADKSVRYHTYLRDDRDELKAHLGLRETKEVLRNMVNSGLSTVHEDQGSSHNSVVTVRLSADYDKNASKRNPSLFNRERFVLTDTTRHRYSYKYVTLSEENDLIIKRINMSKDPERIAAVREKRGFSSVSIRDML